MDDLTGGDGNWSVASSFLERPVSNSISEGLATYSRSTEGQFVVLSISLRGGFERPNEETLRRSDKERE